MRRRREGLTQGLTESGLYRVAAAGRARISRRSAQRPDLRIHPLSPGRARRGDGVSFDGFVIAARPSRRPARLGLGTTVVVHRAHSRYSQLRKLITLLATRRRAPCGASGSRAWPWPGGPHPASTVRRGCFRRVLPRLPTQNPENCRKALAMDQP